MKTHTASTTMALTAIRPVKYGITESKKAELDALSLKVLNAQHTVDQFQSIVNSLTVKANNFQVFLTTAEAKRTQAYNTKKLVDQMVQGAMDLLNNSQISATEIAQARIKTDALDKKLKSVIDKLIYTAEMINKLANVIVRKKALNPLISDDLVSMIGNAGKDANNAVALTLIALKSAFSANALNIESEAAIILGYTEALDFYQFLTGKSGIPLDGDTTPFKTPNSLESQLHKAYSTAKATYTRMEKALVLTTNQLNDAQTSLNKAQVKLKSLQSGLAAANAAALAS